MHVPSGSVCKNIFPHKKASRGVFMVNMCVGLRPVVLVAWWASLMLYVKKFMLRKTLCCFSLSQLPLRTLFSKE